MKRLFLTVGSILFAYSFLRIFYDAPQWGAMVGGWAFWAAVRPKEWM